MVEQSGIVDLAQDDKLEVFRYLLLELQGYTPDVLFGVEVRVGAGLGADLVWLALLTLE